MTTRTKAPINRRKLEHEPSSAVIVKFPKLRLVEAPMAPDRDTVDALERLLRQARQGQVRGIAFAALYAKQHYAVYACGEILRERIYARGMLRELDDELNKLAGKP